MTRRTKHNKYTQNICAELDLHGATREEALRIVNEFFKEERCHAQRIRIIVGKGIHSLEGESILGPAVKSWLVKHGYTFTYAKLANGGEGALEVSV